MATHLKDEESILEEELEVLESIYIHELSVKKDDNGRPCLISLDLHPATADDLEKQYVCMTLTFVPSEHYPHEVPEIVIKNPRGISEEEIQRVTESLCELADERRGGHMLYELTEIAKECLTEGNIPHCPCTICLEHFSEGEPFTKTPCYHYFHHYCLARYIQFVTSEESKEDNTIPGIEIQEKTDGVVCPVCRLPIKYDLESLGEITEPVTQTHQFRLTREIREQQRQMADMFEKQKAKGGIIDLEAEKNKYLIPANLVISLEASSLTSSENSPSDVISKESPQPATSDERRMFSSQKSRPRSGKKVHGYTDRHRSYEKKFSRHHGYHRPRTGKETREYDRIQDKEAFSVGVKEESVEKYEAKEHRSDGGNRNNILQSNNSETKNTLANIAGSAVNSSASDDSLAESRNEPSPINKVKDRIDREPRSEGHGPKDKRVQNKGRHYGNHDRARGFCDNQRRVHNWRDRNARKGIEDRCEDIKGLHQDGSACRETESINNSKGEEISGQQDGQKTPLHGVSISVESNTIHTEKISHDQDNVSFVSPNDGGCSRQRFRHRNGHQWKGRGRGRGKKYVDSERARYFSATEEVKDSPVNAKGHNSSGREIRGENNATAKNNPIAKPGPPPGFDIRQ